VSDADKIFDEIIGAQKVRNPELRALIEERMKQGGEANSKRDKLRELLSGGTMAAMDTGKVEMRKAPGAKKAEEALSTAAELIPFVGAGKAAAEGDYGSAALQAGIDVAGGPLLKGAAALGGKFLAPMLAGIINNKEVRRLPLESYGEFSKSFKPLPSGELYRETNASGLKELASGNYPYGAPNTFFAEVPEMALGQGNNKGVMFKIQSEGMSGRPYLGKPNLEQMFLKNAGEFELKEQPSKILKAIDEMWISPDAYKDMRRSEKMFFDNYIKTLENQGIKVNRVDELPNKVNDEQLKAIGGKKFEYPEAKSSVSGLRVGEQIKNTSSIPATFSNYEIDKGIRSVPMSAFETTNPQDLFYAKNDLERVNNLAEQIKNNGFSSLRDERCL
jgi:hypothetical protein